MSPAWGQRVDSFEGGEPRWIFVESDCRAETTDHAISLIMPHSGRTCEIFEMSCSQGTMALMAYPIEPCIVLNEFRPSVWTRCSSGRLQIGVRVVFPRAEHPVTGGRLNAILWGKLYTDAGQWQELQVESIEKLLGLELVSLRQRFGSDLNLDGAYIDSLVLNAYTGPGRYRVQVDDLSLSGLIPLSATGQRLSPNWRERWRWRQEVEGPTAEQRYWGGVNRPPTWLVYHGESLPWVRALGISGLMLNRLPSEKQLQDIQDADLAVICPPPPHSLSIEASVAKAIQGWHVGGALDALQSDMARKQVGRVAQLPPELQRPLVGEALEQYWMFSRIADEVIVPMPMPVSAGQASERIRWVAENLEITKKRGHGWTSIDVTPDPGVVEQARMVHALLEPAREFDDTLANPTGVRHEVASAVIAGSQGIVFRTFQPLTLQTEGGSALAAALRLIHGDLRLWGPWIQGGQHSAPLAISRDDYIARSWLISNSQLVLAQGIPAGSQYCVAPTTDVALALEVNAPLASTQVLRMTTGRIERMETAPTPGGVSWSIPRPEPIESFVVTTNPVVIDFARRQLAQGTDQRAADQLEVATYNLSLAARILAARYNQSNGDGAAPGTEAAFAQFGRAQGQLDQAYQALRAGQALAASDLAARAADSIQGMLYEAHRVATSNLASPQSSPFVVTPSTLHFHWLLANSCERSQWSELPLPGAETLDISQRTAAGWSKQSRLEEKLDLRVELVPGENDGQIPGLRLAAYAKGRTATWENGQAFSETSSIPGGYEGASLRVRSSAAQVRAGQLVRISGSGRVLRSVAGPSSGMLVYDNQSGPSLGQLVQGKAGEQVAIELYRFAVADGEFRVLAECRGECDIILERLMASVIEPAANRRSFVTAPTMPAGELVLPTIITDEILSK
jgi:hypothetical protein